MVDQFQETACENEIGKVQIAYLDPITTLWSQFTGQGNEVLAVLKIAGESLDSASKNGWDKYDEKIAANQAGFIEKWAIDVGTTLPSKLQNFHDYLMGFGGLSPIVMCKSGCPSGKKIDLESLGRPTNSRLSTISLDILPR